MDTGADRDDGEGSHGPDRRDDPGSGDAGAGDANPGAGVTATDGSGLDGAALGARLRADARRADRRRLVVLAGDRAAGRTAAVSLLAGAGIGPDDATVVADDPLDGYEAVAHANADDLLGRTRTAVVVDAHDRLAPNTLGQVAGVPDGGGLLVLVTPPLSDWPDRRDEFDAGLAVPPFGLADVTGRFRRRLVSTFDHPGVTVVDVDAGRVDREGVVDAAPPPERVVSPPPTRAFPRAAYDACLSDDQVRAVRALERLRDPGAAVVVEADRGRGKSSALGLAAGALAAAGHDVLVTAPGDDRADEAFVRAAAVVDSLGAHASDDGDATREAGRADRATRAPPLRTVEGGRVRFALPPAAADAVEGADPPDVVLVDEAAGVPVRLLDRLLGAPSAGFATTVHGYEGAGRGFTVRFRDRLDAYRERGGSVTDVRMDEPIRYARGDPVESWANRALLLDAAPAVDDAVAGATPEGATYRSFDPAELVADDHRLREVFGLLVAAHYRTEPDDLARLLDAPNLHVRGLTVGGHVVSVALLAREGGLDAATRRASYDGARIRGNLLPDVLTSQVRDEAAAAPVGVRVVRIATHAAVRSRGLGSRLLGEIEAELRASGDGSEAAGDEDDGRGDSPTGADDDGRVDYLGVAYGATPDLVDFWAAAGYATVHLATSRNATSGEYSVLMVRPLEAGGRDLRDRHARWFCRRVGAQLADPLADADPDVVRAALRAADPAAVPAVELDDWAWRTVAGAAYGPGLYDVAPGAFRPPALRAVATGLDALDDRQERLLVEKVLQARPWEAVADDLGYRSRSEALRAFGDACRPLVDAYGSPAALAERDRYVGD